MVQRWNLTAKEWSNVLQGEVEPEALANQLIKDHYLPWAKVLTQFAADCSDTLDLGSGRGENSAVLALQRKRTTLLDWSKENLDFSARLFNAIDISGRFCQADMTKGLPFKAKSFDMVFSCGVLEFFSADDIRLLLDEATRVSRKRVIIMVPNALSLAYRIGKRYMEKTGKWPWGGEVPFCTLRHYFPGRDKVRISEFSVAAKHSLTFLRMPGGHIVARLLTRLLKLNDDGRPALLRQGYLLVTVVEAER